MKKRLLLIAVLCICTFIGQSQERHIQPPRPKVGVVLGGGGAKGASHIGVLKYLEEMGIPVDYVAGTSMGSIIGGFYAMGYSPDELSNIIANINWSEYIGNKIDRPMMAESVRQRNSTMVLNVPFSLENLYNRESNVSFISQLPSAYVNNSSLVNLFNDLCVGYQEEMDFNDLPIPFACVATDMITGDEIVLRSGSVPTAMRASMAIPGVFSPVTIGDKVLVDGGLVNNFPADVLREMGADIIIGVEVTSTKDVTAKDLKSLPQVFAQLLINSTSAKRADNRELCNVHIIPDISGYGMLSFTPEAIDALVGRGYKAAAEFHDQLLSIKQAVDAAAKHPVSKTLRAPKAKNLADEAVLIRSITINNVSEKDSRWLIRKGKIKVGNQYTKDDIERTIKIYRGTGCFDDITYNVTESDSDHKDNLLSDSYDLSIDMQPAKPNVFGLGLRYDTEEGAALLLNVGINEKKFSGSKLNFNAKLSYNPKVNLIYTYSVPSLANFSLSTNYRSESFRVPMENKKILNLRYYQFKASGYISQFHILNLSTAVGLSYSYTTFDKSSIEESSNYDKYCVQNKLLTPFINVAYDNLDDAYFAKHGISAHLNARYHINCDSTYRDLDIGYAFQSYITPGNGKVTIIPQVYGRYTPDTCYFNLQNLYGGEIAGRHFEEQMPFIGVNGVDVAFLNSCILRCDVRYNFYGKHYLTAMYNYLVPLSMFVLDNFSDALGFGTHGAGLKYSYNSFLGPISLTAQWKNRFQENRFGVYFSIGYTF